MFNTLSHVCQHVILLRDVFEIYNIWMKNCAGHFRSKGQLLEDIFLHVAFCTRVISTEVSWDDLRHLNPLAAGDYYVIQKNILSP